MIVGKCVPRVMRLPQAQAPCHSVFRVSRWRSLAMLVSVRWAASPAALRSLRQCSSVIITCARGASPLPVSVASRLVLMLTAVSGKTSFVRQLCEARFSSDQTRACAGACVCAC